MTADRDWLGVSLCITSSTWSLRTSSVVGALWWFVTWETVLWTVGIYAHCSPCTKHSPAQSPVTLLPFYLHRTLSLQKRPRHLLFSVSTVLAFSLVWTLHSGGSIFSPSPVLPSPFFSKFYTSFCRLFNVRSSKLIFFEMSNIFFFYNWIGWFWLSRFVLWHLCKSLQRSRKAGWCFGAFFRYWLQNSGLTLRRKLHWAVFEGFV